MAARMPVSKPGNRDFSLGELKKKSKDELISIILAQSEQKIPVTVFSTKISPLTALVKYLHDDKKLAIKEIALHLNRHEQTIWTIYRQGIKKNLDLMPAKIHIPLGIFAKEHYSILETLVYYLKEEEGMEIGKIAALLDKNIKTIWTCYARHRKKGGSK